MSSPEMYSSFIDALATDVSKGFGSDAADDFEMFSMQCPTSMEFARWCGEGVAHILSQPLDADADRKAVVALLILQSWMAMIHDRSQREMVTRDFWRSYAEVSGAEVA